jgi:hypothetical protein
MSDDIQEVDDSPVLIGDPMPEEEVAALVVITPEDLGNAVDWWNSVASPLFVGALGDGS